MRIAHSLPALITGASLSLTSTAFAAVAVPGASIEDVLGAIIGGSLALAFVLGVYFMPTIIAAIRKHNSVLPIFIINLLLGWSFFGWIIPLVWACTSDVKGRIYKMIPLVTLPAQAPDEADLEIKRLYAA